MNKSLVNPRNWSLPTTSHDPFKQLFDRLMDDGVFQSGGHEDSNVVTSQWTPRVDIKEEPERFVVYADIPGVDPQDIEVQMDKGILTVKGERQSTSTNEGSNFSRVERRHGLFYRRFALPDSADPDGISAAGKNGVLEINIPKRPEKTPRRIQVGSA